MSLVILPAAFAEGGAIPVKYTCQGDNVSPGFSWDGAPAATRSFALIMEDPDASAGTFTHWTIFNIPANVKSLAEGASPRGQRPAGSVEGKNDAGAAGYTGPCPPPGKPHRYFFKLYALSDTLSLKAGAGRSQVLDGLKGITLSEAQVMATYQRK